MAYLSVQERNKLIRDFFDNECMPLLEKKGIDYSEGVSDGGANANFRWIAELANKEGHDEFTVWFNHFSKHLSSLVRWIFIRKLESEPLEKRLADMANYIFILATLIHDRKNSGRGL